MPNPLEDEYSHTYINTACTMRFGIAEIVSKEAANDFLNIYNLNKYIFPVL